jgi:hypothetical protein
MCDTKLKNGYFCTERMKPTAQHQGSASCIPRIDFEAGSEIPNLLCPTTHFVKSHSAIKVKAKASLIARIEFLQEYKLLSYQ